MPLHSKNLKKLIHGPQKGFTLIELLLVILLLGILGVAALQSYFNSTGTFAFFAKEKEVINLIREARSYAINNKEELGQCDGEETAAKNYSVEITNAKIRMYADICGDGLLVKDAKDVLLSENVPFGDYKVGVYLPDSANRLQDPVNINYERGSGKVTVTANGAIIDKRLNRYIVIKMVDEKEDIDSNIVILQLVGLPEIFDNLDDL